MTGPDIGEGLSVVCDGVTGLWTSVGGRSCPDQFFSGDSGRIFWLPPNKRVNWGQAALLARQYTYNGSIPGTLAVVLSYQEWFTLRTVAESHNVWLAASRSDFNGSTDGIYWAEYPRRGDLFFRGSRNNNGTVVPGNFENFHADQPDLNGGAMSMRNLDGTWSMENKDLIANHFVISFTPGISKNYSSMYPLQLCGVLGLCKCDTVALELVLYCQHLTVDRVYALPPGAKFLHLSFNSLSRFPASLASSSLQTLVIDNNLLTSLPHLYSLLPALVFLTVSNNPLSSIGFEQLAQLSPRLQFLTLEETRVSAVSAGALHGYSPRVFQFCASDLAHDARWPSYCGE